MYVASYVSKPEKTLGDILKAVSASGEHLGPKTSMKKVAKKFLTHRDVSAQEAFYRLMSLPLVQGITADCLYTNRSPRAKNTTFQAP